jgi:2-keto-4-pentenoate hydratase/2-oxohepta-3-ene-1,7-dioic acid hydratase in catechol pathway
MNAPTPQGLDHSGPHAVRLVRVELDGEVVTGLVLGDEIVELDVSWTEALAALADGAGTTLVPDPPARRVPLEGTTLEMPLELEGEVYCVGLNYRAHEAEASELVDEVRLVPIIFVKSHRAMAPPAAELPLPSSMSEEFDWEVELGVVIGREAVDVEPEDAWSHVAGYCVVNDITARDVQKRHQQWHLGKNAPASTPIGPWVVERDALPVPIDAQVRLLVNGVEKQRSRTSLLIHDIPKLISLLSRTTTLRPGDVIATGTPSGVGFVRVPPEFLRDGDVVEAVVDGVGALTNLVRTTSAAGVGRDAEMSVASASAGS